MEVTESSLNRNIKTAKVASGSAFILHLPERLVSFAGISGSVSYDPRSEDDIDIFIIANQDCLWLTLLYALIVRRLCGFKEICLSLSMDRSFAHELFSKSLDQLTARDATRVIPVVGSQYYGELLQLSPLTRQHDAGNQVVPAKDASSSAALKLLNFAAYLLVGTYQQAKTRMTNHHFKASGKSQECFEAKMGLHHFFLDSLKYRLIREAEQHHDP